MINNILKLILDTNTFFNIINTYCIPIDTQLTVMIRKQHFHFNLNEILKINKNV